MTAVCVPSLWTTALCIKKMLLHLKACENNTALNNMFLLQTHFITSVECLKNLLWDDVASYTE